MYHTCVTLLVSKKVLGALLQTAVTQGHCGPSPLIKVDENERVISLHVKQTGNLCNSECAGLCNYGQVGKQEYNSCVTFLVFMLPYTKLLGLYNVTFAKKEWLMLQWDAIKQEFSTNAFMGRNIFKFTSSANIYFSYIHLL